MRFYISILLLTFNIFSSPHYSFSTLAHDLYRVCIYDYDINYVEFSSISKLKDTTIIQNDFYSNNANEFDTITFPIFKIKVSIINKLSGSNDHNYIFAKDPRNSFSLSRGPDEIPKNYIVLLRNNVIIAFYSNYTEYQPKNLPTHILSMVNSLIKLLEQDTICLETHISTEWFDCRCKELNDNQIIELIKEMRLDEYFYSKSTKYKSPFNKFRASIATGILIILFGLLKILKQRIKSKRNKNRVSPESSGANDLD